jgi:hypothetical protein
MKRNKLAMSNITLAFTNEGTMGLLYKVKTNYWPGGLAHLLVVALFKKYQPQDTISRVESRQRLSGIKMKKNEDPSILFELINSIEIRYNTAAKKIDEKEFIAVVIGAATIEY